MDATEFAALQALCEIPQWNMDQIPPRISIDILRALDRDGFIEARRVITQAGRREGMLQPSPSPWYSPARTPLAGGNWAAVCSSRVRREGDTVWHQIHVTDAGMGESARRTREQARPLIARVNELGGTPAIRSEFADRANELTSSSMESFCRDFCSLRTRMAAVRRPERLVFCYGLLVALHDSMFISDGMIPEATFGTVHRITRIGTGELRMEHVQTALRTVEQDLRQKTLLSSSSGSDTPSPITVSLSPEADRIVELPHYTNPSETHRSGHPVGSLQKEPSTGSPVELPKEAHLSEADLATVFRVSQSTLRKELPQWRRTHMNNDWKESPNPGPRDPKFLYRVLSIVPLLREIGWNGELKILERPRG